MVFVFVFLALYPNVSDCIQESNISKESAKQVTLISGAQGLAYGVDISLSTGRGSCSSLLPALAGSSRGLCGALGTSGETGRLAGNLPLSGVTGLLDPSCLSCTAEKSGAGLGAALCFPGADVSAAGPCVAGDSGTGACGGGGCPAVSAVVFAGLSSGEKEVSERVRERGREKEVSVEILMGSRKVEARRGRGAGEGGPEGIRVGERPVEKRLVGGGLWEAMVASSLVCGLRAVMKGGGQRRGGDWEVYMLRSLVWDGGSDGDQGKSVTRLLCLRLVSPPRLPATLEARDLRSGPPESVSPPQALTIIYPFAVASRPRNAMELTSASSTELWAHDPLGKGL